jgi:PD-(D/E)XK nuclease superfamily
MKLSETDAAAAFRAIDYGEGLSDEQIAQAWRDIETAIANLFKMERIRSALKAASYVIAQRSLQFELAGVTVVAVPDIIAFYQDAPPLIIDWKVHASGSRDYRLQLALYALALSRCTPHRDFPASLGRLLPTTFRLLEAQLLVGIDHEYVLDAADFDELEDYVATSAAEMIAATGGLGNGDLCAEDFAVTEWPDLCHRCVFQKMCWENADGRA